MAVRYAGDATIRVNYQNGRFRVSFACADGTKGNGTLSPSEVGLLRKESPTSPEAYDKAAKRVVAFLRVKGVHGLGPVERVFKAPCPIIPRE